MADEDPCNVPAGGAGLSALALAKPREHVRRSPADRPGTPVPNDVGFDSAGARASVIAISWLAQRFRSDASSRFVRAIRKTVWSLHAETRVRVVKWLDLNEDELSVRRDVHDMPYYKLVSDKNLTFIDVYKLVDEEAPHMVRYIEKTLTSREKAALEHVGMII